MRAFSPEKLKERRKIFRLSQAALAEITGLSTTYINYLEKGRRQPTADVIARLAWCLRVNESYFFVNTTERKITKKIRRVEDGERLDG